jgi:Spy/CpxP family protein refolding chaperone
MFKLLIPFSVAAAAAAVSAQTSPYAGHQDRPIKALSTQDVNDLMTGQGLGLAKAAELNGYPGPVHVLEHAAALALSEQQRRATEALMQSHRSRARSLGAELVNAERTLDEAFARKAVDPALVARLTAEIGSKQAQLREEHLRTHLEQTALLSREQVLRYAELRGYTAKPASHEKQPQHPRKH